MRRQGRTRADSTDISLSFRVGWHGYCLAIMYVIFHSLYIIQQEQDNKQAGKQQGLAAGAEDQSVVGLEGGGFISASIGANKC